MVSVILRTAGLALAGNARRSLEWILPTSYRGRQEENAENRKYIGRRGVSLRGFVRMLATLSALHPRATAILQVSFVKPYTVRGNSAVEGLGTTLPRVVSLS
jgi:hypothetical protein